MNDLESKKHPRISEAIKMVEHFYPSAHAFSKRYVLKVLGDAQKDKDALEELIFEINTYALEKDSKLTLDAQEFKREILNKIPKLKRLHERLERIRKLEETFPLDWNDVDAMQEWLDSFRRELGIVAAFPGILAEVSATKKMEGT